MHPIEHLRFVARAQGADPAMIAAESASALSQLAFDPSGLVVACRRVVDRHPAVGPLWWMCAHLLTAADTMDRADELVGELHDDPTGEQLVEHLPSGATVMVTGCPSIVAEALRRRGDVRVILVGDDHESDMLARRLERADIELAPIGFPLAAAMASEVDLVLLESDALDDRRSLLALGGGVLAAVATAADLPVWLVAGRGRTLPVSYVDAMLRRLGDESPSIDVIDPSSVAQVVTPGLTAPPSSLAFEPECPVAAELFR